MSAYYNEFDKFAAAWLRELIKEKLIADGEVDERDIREVQPSDLRGFKQCHFFAGIGGWSYALRLAGFSDDRVCWTGSCPCQSFSAAGKQTGLNDERHLWPAWFRLIRECRPPVLFGEQVSAAIRHGWWDLVQTDLEREKYACGMAVFGAHSVGAPHIRQRLYFVAESMRSRTGDSSGQSVGTKAAIDEGNGSVSGERLRFGVEGSISNLADARSTGRPEGWPESGNGQVADGGADDAVADPSIPRREEEGEHRSGPSSLPSQPEQCGGDGELADAQSQHNGSGNSGASGRGELTDGGNVGDPGSARLPQRERDGRIQREEMGTHEGQAIVGRSDNPWNKSYWLPCKDGKLRSVPVEPAFFPLVNGTTPGRVGILRGAGNAIVPQQAAAFVKAYMETMNEG